VNVVDLNRNQMLLGIQMVCKNLFFQLMTYGYFFKDVVINIIGCFLN
jgi:hypothetical protein